MPTRVSNRRGRILLRVFPLVVVAAFVIILLVSRGSQQPRDIQPKRTRVIVSRLARGPDSAELASGQKFYVRFEANNTADTPRLRPPESLELQRGGKHLCHLSSVSDLPDAVYCGGGAYGSYGVQILGPGPIRFYLPKLQAGRHYQLCSYVALANVPDIGPPRQSERFCRTFKAVRG